MASRRCILLSSLSENPGIHRRASAPAAAKSDTIDAPTRPQSLNGSSYFSADEAPLKEIHPSWLSSARRQRGALQEDLPSQ